MAPVLQNPCGFLVALVGSHFIPQLKLTGQFKVFVLLKMLALTGSPAQEVLQMPSASYGSEHFGP